MSNKTRIGLFGFGTVGQGFYEILQAEVSDDIELKQICIRNPDKERPLPSDHFTTDRSAILDDAEIDVVVELTDDAEAACDIAERALAGKKKLVTANKKMVANNLEWLIGLQKEYQTPVLYEAAVCGAIPILHNVDTYFRHEPIDSFSGILNGSCNYILTKMQGEGIGYNEALAQAQTEGFAESDPTLDVSGQDAANKLTILARHALGVKVTDNLLTIGIDNISRADIDLVSSYRKKLKLVTIARRSSRGILLGVLPGIVTENNDLYNVEQEVNAVQLEGKYSGKHFASGLGAGSLPTASAVFADFRKIITDYTYDYDSKDNQKKLDNTASVKIVLRTEEPELVELLFHERPQELHRNDELVTVEGVTTLNQLKTNFERIQETGSFVAIDYDETVKTDQQNWQGQHEEVTV